MNAVEQTRATLTRVEACEALGVARATYYRKQARQSVEPESPQDAAASRKRSPRALTQAEEQLVLDYLHSPPFMDRSVPQVYASLLDEGIYVSSMRTMYRVLDRHQEVRERRNQANRPSYTKPQLLAIAPNCVWSWDITKLRGPRKGSYFYLYVLIDIYSRYVVGWMVASRENAVLAEKLWEESVDKYNIQPGQLTGHSDRGSPMTAGTFAQFLAEFGITQSLNRPRVSNDNPYSEAHFKTLKYSSGYPGRFGCIEDARAWCAGFFEMYNNSNHHSGLGWMTPADVHFGRVDQIVAVRATALDAAYAKNPERFVNQRPVPPRPPCEVWINQPLSSAAAQ